MPKPLPAMTVTIEVAGGPVVCLTYDGRWDSGPIVPHMRVAVRDQSRPAPRGGLYDLLADASSLLALYAASQEHWPAELRPDVEQPPGAPTGDPSSRPSSTDCAGAAAWQK